MDGLPANGGAFNGRDSKIIDALRMLQDAKGYAVQLGRNPWDFAEEIVSLRHLGLSNGDLRWLICKGLIEHRKETSKAGAERRQFLPKCGLSFSKKSCFVLSQDGHDYLVGRGSQFLQSELPSRPTWDPDLQELRLGEVIVKQFKVPAPNQETVLAVFEEEGWPVCIDDPLTPADNIDPKRRLHDTINSLNRNQRRKSIRFHGNGSGSGIRWELVHASPSA